MNIIIEGTLYIPILNTIILYIQQLAQQSDNQWSGGSVLGHTLHLIWDYYTKLVQNHSARNLPALFTVPGGTRTQSYIVQHIHYWNGSYLGENDKNGT